MRIETHDAVLEFITPVEEVPAMRRWLKWLGGTELVQYWYEYVIVGMICGALGGLTILLLSVIGLK